MVSEEREVMLEVYYWLNEVAHDYGDEVDFGEWYFKRTVSKNLVEIEVWHDDGRWGMIVLANGYAINVVNFNVLKEFLEWLELQ